MTDTKRIFLIVNPISGTKDKNAEISKIQHFLQEHDVSFSLVSTLYKGHASQLAHRAVADGYKTIVAVGGDGTVNEVASALTGNKAALGIIPCGSGNGLARNLGLPFSPAKALETILNGKTRCIDYCTVNGLKYFCAFGTGFDAAVAHTFAGLPHRGLFNYIKSAIQVYKNYNPHSYHIKLQDQEIEGEYYMVAVCNGAQYGNNAYIAPKALDNDGLLDIVLVKPVSFLKKIDATFKMFLRTINDGQNITYRKSPHMEISDNTDRIIKAHIDGEPIELKGKLRLQCHNKQLTVFIP